MGIRQRVKNLMDDLPFGADIYWQLRGKRKPWSAHYELEGLKAVLPQALADLASSRASRSDLPAETSSSQAKRSDLPAETSSSRASRSDTRWAQCLPVGLAGDCRTSFAVTSKHRPLSRGLFFSI